jgi:hypothetical protein
MRIRRAVVASAAALTVLAGCGSDSDDTSSEDPSLATSSDRAEPAEPVDPAEPADQLTAATFASSTSQAQTDAT